VAVPRYLFKPEDLAPLRRILDHPVAQRILSRAIPLTQFDKPPAAVDWVTDPLPVSVQTRGNPRGLPLGALNEYLKKRVPGVRSVVVRDNSVLVTWDQPPTSEIQARLKAALTDGAALKRVVETTVAPAPASDAELKAKLLAPETPDDEWLRTFRQVQVAALRRPDDPTPIPVPFPRPPR
jgi:hypothetical protein